MPHDLPLDLEFFTVRIPLGLPERPEVLTVFEKFPKYCF
jgi:hypothetical protein